jgi:hypothetical protein
MSSLTEQYLSISLDSRFVIYVLDQCPVSIVQRVTCPGYPFLCYDTPGKKLFWVSAPLPTYAIWEL